MTKRFKVVLNGHLRDDPGLLVRYIRARSLQEATAKARDILGKLPENTVITEDE